MDLKSRYNILGPSAKIVLGYARQLVQWKAVLENCRYISHLSPTYFDRHNIEMCTYVSGFSKANDAAFEALHQVTVKTG